MPGAPKCVVCGGGLGAKWGKGPNGEIWPRTAWRCPQHGKLMTCGECCHGGMGGWGGSRKRQRGGAATGAVAAEAAGVGVATDVTQVMAPVAATDVAARATAAAEAAQVEAEVEEEAELVISEEAGDAERFRQSVEATRAEAEAEAARVRAQEETAAARVRAEEEAARVRAEAARVRPAAAAEAEVARERPAAAAEAEAARVIRIEESWRAAAPAGQPFDLREWNEMMNEVDRDPCPGLRIRPSLLCTRYKESQTPVVARSVRGRMPPIDEWLVPEKLRLSRATTFRQVLDTTNFYERWKNTWRMGEVKCAYHRLFLAWAARRSGDQQKQQQQQQHQRQQQ